MMHNPQSTSAAIVAFMQASGVNLGKNAYYAQLAAAGHIGEFMDDLKALAVTANANLQAMNFQFLGIDLAAIPTFRFWDCEGWSEIGLFLIPVVSAGLQAVSMWISQKMNNQVATNADGEQDVDAAKTANQTNATMMLMMPLMSLWIGFTLPASLGVYWIANSVLMLVQEKVLNKYFKKSMAAEDEAREKARMEDRLRRMEEARVAQQQREAEKKSLKEKQKAAQAAKAAKAEKAKKATTENGRIGDRPYARGRSFNADHYGE